MRPVSAAFLAAVKSSHTVVTQVDVLSAGATLATGLKVVDGSVSIDRNAEVRARCDVVIGDTSLIPTKATDLLAPFGNEIRIYRGIRFPATGAVELVSLGVFRIQSVSVEDPGRGVRIAGLDRSQAVRDMAFEDVFTIPAGAIAYTTAIQSLIGPAVPGVQFDFMASGALTPLLVFDDSGDGSRWSAAQQMATALGSDLYFNGDGICVLRPQIIGTSGAASVTVADGSNGVLMSASRAWSRDGIYNAVVATSSNASIAQPVRATAYDTNPASPTYYYGKFGKKVRHYASPFIADQGQAVSAAQAILAQSLGTSEALKFSIIPNPALEPGDLITVSRSALGLNRSVFIDSIDIGLTADDPMTLTVRAAV